MDPGSIIDFCQSRITFYESNKSIHSAAIVDELNEVVAFCEDKEAEQRALARAYYDAALNPQRSTPRKPVGEIDY